MMIGKTKEELIKAAEDLNRETDKNMAAWGYPAAWNRRRIREFWRKIKGLFIRPKD